MKKFFLFFIPLILLSCRDSESNDSGQKIPVISLTQDKFVVESYGGSISVPFSCTDSWTAGSSVDWCTVSPSIGYDGNAVITINVKENTSYDERNGQVMIISGSTSKSFTITQKQLDAITVTSNKVEVDSQGGEAKIEVKSNVEYSYKIEDSASSWISVSGTRALMPTTLNLKIDENLGLENRQGIIRIFFGNLEEKVTVFQQGSKPSIILTAKDYTVSSSKETIKVELQSNISYSVSISDDWVAENKTRAMSSYTHYFDISENAGYDSRKAVITFFNENEGITEKINITQLQKNAILVANTEYVVPFDQSTLDFEVQSNVEYKTDISCDWIKQVSTRGLSGQTLRFSIDNNESGAERSATISFSSDDIVQKINIVQKKRPSMSVGQTQFDVRSSGDFISFEIVSESDYSVQSAEQWLKEIASSSNIKKFEVLPNEEYDERTGIIYVTNNDTKDVIAVTVIQAQKDAIIVSSAKDIKVDETGGSYTLSLNSNTNYEITIGESWIKETTTRALKEYSHNFAIESLPEGVYSRTGTITITNKDKNITEKITVTQEASLHIDKTELVVLLGETDRINLLSGIPSEVTWNSSNTSVATVTSEGKVIACGIGEADITVTDKNNKQQICKVVVKDITGFVYASYNGGSIMSNNGLILYGSSLNFYIHNNSLKSVYVKSMQLIDGQTGKEGNVMSIDETLDAKSSKGWSVRIGLAGIHNPICKFVYTYNGQEYNTTAQYEEFNFPW